MRLKDKVTVVTGGTRGLGRAIAERFVDEGATVVCAARNPYDIQQLINQLPDRVLFHETDVTDPDSVDGLMDAAVAAYGRIDVLVANAGVNRDGKVDRLTPEDWRSMMDTNLNGAFYSLQSAARRMIPQGGGRIITVSSSMASRVAIGAAGYSATKAAIETLTKVSAIELGRKGIQVNCLAPGVLEDGMGRELSQNKKVWEAYHHRFSLGRAGKLDEAALGAVFLASEDSSYVNGHVLEVNGGLLWA
ncbi:SDR family NAD(P)-dependent oxidoreductase [Streptomyces xanthochromogenes]|uniref:3-oxoacyl-[acyl-carrier-protein] reductase FabG n=1 Tax=Streptomyces xanthochromogenes TaxID=67384 RepID=A0ABQ3AL18_9ACTN|nr:MULTISPECIES: SDR family NAD(P)-dependent oxidoreductase [Streptomyces]MYV91357.1 SDR family oxidoreductase [Streptomyces sp. SID1034]GGY59309.1 3-oxoacyl-[acyl-carrier-protein] reductase FabG [Streptomyces xanthochromogenes]